MVEVVVSFDPRRHGVCDPEEIVRVADSAGVFAIEWPVVFEEDLYSLPRFPAPLNLATVRVLRNRLRDEADETFVREAIGAAADRGCRLVVGPAGVPESAAERETNIERLRRIGECAAAEGVEYALETGPGLCVSHRAMLDTLQDVQSGAVGLSFDPVVLHACNEYFNSEVALAKVCHRVVHVRAGDCTGEPGDARCLPLGTGEVDFVRMGELLRVCAFRGPYCVSLPSEVQNAGRLSGALREAAAELWRCGVLRT